MKKTAVLVALMIGALTLPSRSQYVVQIPYVIDQYTTQIAVGSTFFSIPRPDATYESVRLRGLSDGFAGFIRDSYSDHFRNPANRIGDVPAEIFGDLGAVSDSGKFMFGGVVAAGTNSWSAFVNLERLMRSSNQSDRFTMNSGGSSNLASFAEEFSPKKIGVRLSYSSDTAATSSLGLSYEYSSPILDWASTNTTQSLSSSYSSMTKNSRDNSSKGHMHRFSGGSIIRLENSTLELDAAGLFTSHSITDYSVYNYSSSSTWTSVVASYPTDVSTRAGLFEAVYTIGFAEKMISRFLARAAYTKYDVSGNSLSEYRNSYSPSYSSRRATLSNRDASGSVIDFIVGAGVERAISEVFTVYMALSANYVRNKMTGVENGSTIDSSGSAVTIGTFSNSLSDLREGYDIRLPAAVEYSAGEHVTFRGGLEPRYRKGETTTVESAIYDPYGGYMANKAMVEARGLSLNSTLGASVYDRAYGQVDVVFGNVLTDTHFWSVAMRYFL